jgi:pentalenolactone synthase
MAPSIERTQTPAGAPAWHVVRYDEVKALLADTRLGRGHPDPARAGWYSSDIAGRPASRSESEYAEHAWWRKAMNSVFSPAGLERMTPAVQRIAGQVAGDLARMTAPVDLNAWYSTPLTSLVMCALLGVPAEDVASFRSWTEEGAQTADLERSMSGMKLLMAYAARLVSKRRAGSKEDLIAVLVNAGPADSRSHLGRVVKLVAGMLAFGRETPASVIDWGTMLLLTNPDQRDLLRERPGLVTGAVEEILRLFKPHAATEQGLMRYAHADIDTGDVTIRTGDMVLLDVMMANHDADVFTDPGRFDITRSPNPQLTFGSGAYMCNFTRLGRAEIRIGLATLFANFPTLSLAEPPDQLKLKEHLRTGGLESLSVTW